jgi:hypothetical protein
VTSTRGGRRAPEILIRLAFITENILPAEYADAADYAENSFFFRIIRLLRKIRASFLRRLIGKPDRKIAGLNFHG